MRLIGHGIDIVELISLGRFLSHAEGDFLDECFTASERGKVPADGPRRRAHIAGQFAAKEAVMKALGTGFGDGVAFADVEIGRTASGAPTVKLTGGAARVAESCGVNGWLLSISHGEAFAVASAIAIGE
jgi:holo-[acyl-carrier protein] synthase